MAAAGVTFPESYHYSDQFDDFDLDRLHSWLSKKAYWSLGIPKDRIEVGFRNSVACGVFHAGEGQIGCARVITDQATFGYLADVWLEPTHRGQGLALLMLRRLMADARLQGLRRIMLTTRDMHRLYRKVGFEAVDNPEIMMEILDAHVYQR